MRCLVVVVCIAAAPSAHARPTLTPADVLGPLATEFGFGFDATRETATMRVGQEDVDTPVNVVAGTVAARLWLLEGIAIGGTIGYDAYGDTERRLGDMNVEARAVRRIRRVSLGAVVDVVRYAGDESRGIAASGVLGLRFDDVWWFVAPTYESRTGVTARDVASVQTGWSWAATRYTYVAPIFTFAKREAQTGEAAAHVVRFDFTLATQFSKRVDILFRLGFGRSELHDRGGMLVNDQDLRFALALQWTLTTQSQK